jgi:ABC-type amino acid transport substrate-binding protein
METKYDERAEQPIEDKSTGGSLKTCLLLTGLLFALGLGAAGVTIGSLALNKANDNEDTFTDLDFNFASATDDDITANEDDTSVFFGGSPTLQAIYDRGALKCAVVLSPGFAGVEPDTGELYGFDIDIVSSCWHVLSI